MRICPFCDHPNREGVFFCEECGQPFVGEQNVLATHKLMADDLANQNERITWGTAQFKRDSSIVIHIRDFSTPISLAPKDELFLGRSDDQSGMLDLDLGPFGASEKGVSRRHAAIRRGEDTLTLVDLTSTNGTFLNGQRLSPNQPRVLRDGDEIRVGKLAFHIYFK